MRRWWSGWWGGVGGGVGWPVKSGLERACVCEWGRRRPGERTRRRLGALRLERFDDRVEQRGLDRLGARRVHLQQLVRERRAADLGAVGSQQRHRLDLAGRLGEQRGEVERADEPLGRVEVGVPELERHRAARDLHRDGERGEGRHDQRLALGDVLRHDAAELDAALGEPEERVARARRQLVDRDARQHERAGAGHAGCEQAKMAFASQQAKHQHQARQSTSSFLLNGISRGEKTQRTRWVNFVNTVSDVFNRVPRVGNARRVSPVRATSR